MPVQRARKKPELEIIKFILKTKHGSGSGFALDKQIYAVLFFIDSKMDFILVYF